MSHNQTESAATFPANVPVPDAGDSVTAASVQVIAQSLGDRTQNLKVVKVDAAGGTLTGGAVNGATLTGCLIATCTGSGVWSLNNTTAINLAGFMDITGFLAVAGRCSHRRARVALSDAAHAIDVTQGDVFVLFPNPAAPRIITCNHGASPIQGETLTFLWFPTAAGGGVQYTIKNNAGAVICTLVQSESTSVGNCTVTIEHNGTAWHLAENSGTYLDVASTAPDIGVVPGVAA